MSLELVSRILDVIERDISPLTFKGVQQGNKVFGAAILLKHDLSLVLAETNNQSESPLWHGEMHAIRRFFEIPRDNRPDPKDCIFITTHEPCSLCLSGITWSGFDNFYYFFTYEDSRDAFATPYDIQILQAVYQTPDPGHEISVERPLYNRTNAYFTSYSIKDLVKQINDDSKRKDLDAKVKNIVAIYDDIEQVYQKCAERKGIFVS